MHDPKMKETTIQELFLLYKCHPPLHALSSPAALVFVQRHVHPAEAGFPEQWQRQGWRGAIPLTLVLF